MRVGAVVAASMFVVALAGACPGRAEAQLAALAAAATAPADAGPRSELEWIVADIVQGIARGAAAARRTPGAPPRIEARLRPGHQHELLNVATLDIRANGKPIGVVSLTRAEWHVWTPAAYADVARALVGGPVTIAKKGGSAAAAKRAAAPAKGAAAARTGAVPSRATQAAAADVALIGRLIDPRLEVFLAEEQRVSAAMAAAPADPLALEQGALLVVSLALREAAGGFDDVRPLLSRATAFLALSRALRRGTAPGQGARLAATVIDVLAGRDDLALPVVGTWPAAADHSIAAAWTRGLLLRMTGDWRQVTVVPESSRLERLEYARALGDRVGSARQLAFIDAHAGDQEADWARLALNPWSGPSVEAGNRFVEVGLEAELRVISRVWLHTGRGDAPIDTVLAALNDTAPARHRAIDWPTWAGVLQRHLCASLRASSRHLRMLGLEQERAAWIGSMQKEYGALRFFPLLAQAAARDEAQYRAAAVQTRALLASQPQLITPHLSALARDVPDVVAKGDTFPSDVAWFTPHVPTGTAYDLENRSLGPSRKRGVPIDQVVGWAARRPYDMWLAWSAAWLPAAGVPAFDDVERAMARVAPYDLRALDHMFRYLDLTAEQSLSIASGLCELDVDECERLGNELVAAGREADAVSVFERFVAGARDEVGLSNSVGWLVHHYWDAGQRDKAVALAERAGAVHSQAGLGLLGEIRERQGRLAEAREIFNGITERYGKNNEALAAHLLREARRTRKPALIAQVADAVPDAFPHGVEGADPFGLPAPPFDGVVFLTFGPRAARTGLRPTDVIVGVDGYRVRSSWQFRVLVRGAFDGPVTFVVWRDKRYQRVEVPLPQRWFGAAFDTFPSARQARVSS